jgi:hypothetical protein
VSDNPLDDIFDGLTECAAVLKDHARGTLSEAEALARVAAELRSIPTADVPIGWLKFAQTAAAVCRDALDAIEGGRLSAAEGLALIRELANADGLLITMHESGYIRYIRHHSRPPAGGAAN